MVRHSENIIHKARELRLQKLSYMEIGKVLKIPDKTISHWCCGMKMDPHESLKINNELRRKKIKFQDDSLVPVAKNISSEQARLFTALLYGCEGCKYPATNTMAFVNSDYNLIKTFIFLLRKGFELDETKFRVQLQIHDYHDFSEIKQYWSKLLNIPEDKFIKPTITSPKGKMKRQNYFGTCALRYMDNKVQLRLLGIFEKFCTI